MSYHKNKIRWSFIDAKTAIKAIDLLGARALDRINFYVKNKKIDCSGYHHLNDYIANKRAKKEIRKFFKNNQGINDFVKFIRD